MSNKIWKYGKGRYKVYTEDPKIRAKLASWVDSKHSCTYSKLGKTVGWDFIIPSKKLKKTVEITGYTEKPQI